MTDTHTLHKVKHNTLYSDGTEMAALEENGGINGIDAPDEDNIEVHPQIYTELEDSDFIISGKSHNVKLTRDYLRYSIEGKSKGSR